MVAAGPTQPTAEMPFPNVPLIHRPDDVPAAVTLSRAPLQVRKRLLVVDDEHPVLKLIVRILSSDNYEIQSTDSGVEAARLLDVSGFRGVDLLVTDLMMPGMNGRQLAEEVRKRYPTVRVLYVTGFSDTLFKGVNELGDGESFIEKPFGAEGLIEATRLLMFGHISDGQVQKDKREHAEEWTDGRLRTKVVRRRPAQIYSATSLAADPDRQRRSLKTFCPRASLHSLTVIMTSRTPSRACGSGSVSLNTAVSLAASAACNCRAGRSTGRPRSQCTAANAIAVSTRPITQSRRSCRSVNMRGSS